ncbi:MAG TPA: baseplate J/gp47 family protein, partial [candidate division Zixibacteria bacterium]|nr:baseplate J/gp47 family protein [candidate division Zixibacteria bacterium]
ASSPRVRARPRARPSVPAARRLPRVLPAVMLGLLVLLGAAAAAVAPAATITIVPVSATAGPKTYSLELEDPEVTSGRVEATQPGTAGGTYHDLAAAEGAVVFLNWNIGRAVLVPAGAQVAAGDVVFETVEAVAVPPARLIRFNPLTVESGEASVGVVAVEPGPQGNVAAGAINTVVDESLANQLRGLPDNPERLVVNREATAGGVDRSGPLIREEDVAATRSALVEALTAQIEEARRELGDAVVAETAPSDPSIAVPEGLAGTRDQESFELSGSQEYRWVHADRASVVAAAEERALADASLVAEGFGLDPDSLQVEIVRAATDGEALLVEARVTGRMIADVDPGAVRSQVAGLSEQEAVAALAPLGAVDVELWPGWVDAVPRLEWRIDVRVVSDG